MSYVSLLTCSRREYDLEFVPFFSLGGAICIPSSSSVEAFSFFAGPHSHATLNCF